MTTPVSPPFSARENSDVTVIHPFRRTYATWRTTRTLLRYVLRVFFFFSRFHGTISERYCVRQKLGKKVQKKKEVRSPPQEPTTASGNKLEPQVTEEQIRATRTANYTTQKAEDIEALLITLSALLS